MRKNAKDAVFGAAPAAAGAHRLVGRLLLRARRAARREGAGRCRSGRKRLGVGRKTGIDIPGEFAGLIPDSEWRNKGYDEYQKCTEKAKVPQGTTAALYKCGGIERPWTTGDNVSLAVGQGDLQATPLQLAEAYSTIINDGKVVRPHLGLQVEDGRGRLVEEIRTPIRRRVHFGPGYRDAIMAGLHGAATARRAARRRTCSPTSRSGTATSCTARPAPPSASRTPTSPGTPATSPTR